MNFACGDLACVELFLCVGLLLPVLFVFQYTLCGQYIAIVMLVFSLYSSTITSLVCLSVYTLWLVFCYRDVVVFSIKVYYYQSGSHILACAPSNNAADLLAERILGSSVVTRKHLLRLNAASRKWDSVSSNIRDCCNYNKMSGQYHFPRREDLMGYRIIITTLVTAGRYSACNKIIESHHEG